MIALVACTYNQPKDLDAYLWSLRAQTHGNFHIWIADDGSTPETARVILLHQENFFGKRLHHIWHEDNGYRKCLILNKTLVEVKKYDPKWLIFTDSDLVVHPNFIDDHVSISGPNRLFMGRRVDLGTHVSEWIRNHPQSLFNWPFYLKVMTSAFVSPESTPTVDADENTTDIHRTRGITRNVKRLFRIQNSLLSKICGWHRVPDLLGSNFSICPELFYKVNGFNEALEHYWGEDGDLFVRARNAGADISGRKGYAVQLHLWHQPRKAPPDAEESYLKCLKNTQYVRCESGLSNHALD